MSATRSCNCNARRSRAERGQALRRRGRLGGDARDVPAGRRAPRVPEIGRRLDRARRDLAVLPARHRDRGVRAGRRRWRRRTSRSASSRSPARTPIIMAQPMGFYAKHGLNVEVIKTAGWAVIRDKTLNKEYDAAHMLSPMPLAITLGVGSNADPLHRAGDREHQRPGDHARRSSTRTSAIRSRGRASSSRCRSTIRCTTICCATTRRARHRSRHRHADPRRAAAGNGREPARRQSSTASSAPIR